jgi:hypothetical protein
MRGIRAGAAILAQSVVAAPEGAVHLAVVDPGVGTDRRGVAVVTARDDLLVGPDNGLLPPAADALGGGVAAFELTDPRYVGESPSATFHGRDVFAPAAAHLALGVRVEELGPEVAADGLARLPARPPSVKPGRLEADVVRVDWYGNLQLDATQGDLVASGLEGAVVVSCAAGDLEAEIGRTFSDAAPGNLVVYADSGGHVAIACNGSSARDRLQDPERVTVKRKA